MLLLVSLYPLVQIFICAFNSSGVGFLGGGTVAGIRLDLIDCELGPVPRLSPVPTKSYELGLQFEPCFSCLEIDLSLLRPRPFFWWRLLKLFVMAAFLASEYSERSFLGGDGLASSDGSMAGERRNSEDDNELVYCQI